MLKIKANPTFIVPVKITVADSDTPVVVDVTYRHKGVNALADWWQVAAGKPVRDALNDIVETIDGLHDENGQPQAYSDVTLIKLLDNHHAAGQELLTAYFKRLQESRVKN